MKIVYVLIFIFITYHVTSLLLFSNLTYRSNRVYSMYPSLEFFLVLKNRLFFIEKTLSLNSFYMNSTKVFFLFPQFGVSSYSCYILVISLDSIYCFFMYYVFVLFLF